MEASDSRGKDAKQEADGGIRATRPPRTFQNRTKHRNRLGGLEHLCTLLDGNVAPLRVRSRFRGKADAIGRHSAGPTSPRPWDAQTGL